MRTTLSTTTPHLAATTDAMMMVHSIHRTTTTTTIMTIPSLRVRTAASTTRTLLIRHRRGYLVCLLGRPSPMAPNNWTGRGGPSLFLHFVSCFCLFVSPSSLELLEQLVETGGVGFERFSSRLKGKHLPTLRRFQDATTVPRLPAFNTSDMRTHVSYFPAFKHCFPAFPQTSCTSTTITTRLRPPTLYDQTIFTTNQPQYTPLQQTPKLALDT
jgi:hypothetical protein